MRQLTQAGAVALLSDEVWIIFYMTSFMAVFFLMKRWLNYIRSIGTHGL